MPIIPLFINITIPSFHCFYSFINNIFCLYAFFLNLRRYKRPALAFSIVPSTYIKMLSNYPIKQVNSIQIGTCYHITLSKYTHHRVSQIESFCQTSHWTDVRTDGKLSGLVYSNQHSLEFQNRFELNKYLVSSQGHTLSEFVHSARVKGLWINVHHLEGLLKNRMENIFVIVLNIV